MQVTQRRGRRCSAADAPTEHGVTVGAVLLRPASAGFLRLASADPLAPPLIQPSYLSHGEDVRLLVEGTKLARRILAAPAFAPYWARSSAATRTPPRS